MWFKKRITNIESDFKWFQNSGVKPGAPTRRHRAAMGGDEEEEEEEEEGEGEDEDGEGVGGGVNVADLLPRNDIR